MNYDEYKKSDPKVAHIIQATYPNYKGRRKVRVQKRESYHVTDYWDGGSRNYVQFFNVRTGQNVAIESVDYEQQEQSNPFGLRLGTVRLSSDVVAVENTIFCGKNLGIRIYVHPDAEL
jgi:hypothetical protein